MGMTKIWRMWLARPNATIIALYLALRALLLGLGVRFDAANLSGWMQISDIALLRHDLANTLLYLHSQPPLLNLIVGLALKCGDAAFPIVMECLYATVTLAGILAFRALANDLSHRPALALILAGWLCIAPAVILFSTKLYYDGLVPWIVMLALWGLHRGRMLGSWQHYLWGFSMLSAVVLLRTQFHWLLFPALLLIWIWSGRGQVRMIMATATGPFAVILASIAKNTALFGMTALTSWAPLNLNLVTTDRLPDVTRHAMIRDGRLSPLADIPAFSEPQTYIALLGSPPRTGQPSLDNASKSTGQPNWNHLIYVEAGSIRAHDVLPALLADKSRYARTLVTSLYHFHRPSSEFKGLETNLARIAGWERIANAIIGLQPAAWFGGTLNASRPTMPVLQPAYSELLISALFVGAWISMIVLGWRHIRARSRPTADEALMGATVLVGGFILLVSSAFDVWENNRAHYDIAPCLMLGALWFVTRRVRRP